MTRCLSSGKLKPHDKPLVKWKVKASWQAACQILYLKQLDRGKYFPEADSAHHTICLYNNYHTGRGKSGPSIFLNCDFETKYISSRCLEWNIYIHINEGLHSNTVIIVLSLLLIFHNYSLCESKLPQLAYKQVSFSMAAEIRGTHARVFQMRVWVRNARGRDQSPTGRTAETISSS